MDTNTMTIKSFIELNYEGWNGYGALPIHKS